MCFPYVISMAYAAFSKMFRAKISALGLLNKVTVKNLHVISRSKLQFCIEFFRKAEKPVFRIRIRIQIRIYRIHMFLGLPDPDPDPIIKQK